MTTLIQLKRIRWAVRATLLLGVAASVTANVLHALPNPISQSIAAWPPLALLLTVELISRVPVHTTSLAAARLVTTATIAAIAAWVSYWHMAGVAAKYGEVDASPYLIPISVDGLIVIASICLVELAGRIRVAEELAAVPVGVRMVGPVHDHPRPIGPMPAPADEQVLDHPLPIGPMPKLGDNLSPRKAAPRKPHPSAKERVEAAHKRTPKATDEQLAVRLELSVKTVQRWRPKPVAEAPKVNGRETELTSV